MQAAMATESECPNTEMASIATRIIEESNLTLPKLYIDAFW